MATKATRSVGATRHARLWGAGLVDVGALSVQCVPLACNQFPTFVLGHAPGAEGTVGLSSIPSSASDLSLNGCNRINVLASVRIAQRDGGSDVDVVSGRGGSKRELGDLQDAAGTCTSKGCSPIFTATRKQSNRGTRWVALSSNRTCGAQRVMQWKVDRVCGP